MTFAEIFRCILTNFLLGHFLSYLTRGLAGECLLTFSQRAPSRLFPRCMSESSCTVVWLFCLFPADYLIELLLPLHLLSRSSFLLRLIAQLILVPSLLFPRSPPSPSQLQQEQQSSSSGRRQASVRVRASLGVIDSFGPPVSFVITNCQLFYCQYCLCSVTAASRG